nr:TniB family NTP-binding protein [uncultured Pseudomonas sp.]
MSHSQQQILLKTFSKQVIFFPDFQIAYSQLQKSVEATALRGTPSCAFIMGMTGAGKTTLCELFRDSFGPPQEILTKDGVHKKIPALYVSPSSTPMTNKGFCLAILEELGCMPPRTSFQELTQMLVRQLDTAGVELLIFDEIQRLLRPDAEKTRQAFLDWVVALLSLTKIPIALCGDETCEKLLITEAKANSPFARRYCYTATLEYFTFEDNLETPYYMTLSELDKAMYKIFGLQGAIHLQAPSIALPLFIASAGILEYMRQVIYEALSIAVSRPHPMLTVSDFVDACHTLRLPRNLAGKTKNPFNLTRPQCLAIIDNYYSKPPK